MTQLRQVQLCQLDIALEVKRICEKHGLRYFLLAGSALGAIRHKGFIPWDDDMDVGMFREDYEKFAGLCKSELDSAYFYQDWNVDPGYALPFAKLRIRGTRYTEKAAQKSKAMDGIYIDIFPLDAAPSTEKGEQKAARSYYFWFRLLLAKKGYLPASGGVKKFVYILLKCFGCLFPVSFVKNRITGIMTGQAGSAEYLANYGGSYGYWKERLEANWFSEMKYVNFEGYQMPVPAKYHEYLTHLYGDYMTPPPVGKRGNRHGICQVDFGTYQIRCGKE